MPMKSATLGMEPTVKGAVSDRGVLRGVSGAIAYTNPLVMLGLPHVTVWTHQTDTSGLIVAVFLEASSRADVPGGTDLWDEITAVVLKVSQPAQVIDVPDMPYMKVRLRMEVQEVEEPGPDQAVLEYNLGANA